MSVSPSEFQVHVLDDFTALFLGFLMVSLLGIKIIAIVKEEIFRN